MSVPLTEPTLLALKMYHFELHLLIQMKKLKAMIIIRKNERCLILDKLPFYLCLIFLEGENTIIYLIIK